MKTITDLTNPTWLTAEVQSLQLNTSAGTQYRESPDEDAISDYYNAMMEGATFPPIKAVFDGGKYIVVDGFHRLQAMYRTGRQTCLVEYIDGDLADAQFLALSANSRHGLRRSNADKENAVKAALAHPLTQDLPDIRIAEICGVSRPFVGSVRDPSIKAKQTEARNRHALSKVTEISDKRSSTTAHEESVGHLEGADAADRDEQVHHPGEGNCEPSEKITSHTGNQKVPVTYADIEGPYELGMPNDETQATDSDIECRSTTQSPEEELIGIPVGGEGPDEAELLANEKKLEADREMVANLLDADDQMKHLFEENKRLTHEIVILDLRVKELMNEKRSAVKLAEKLQRELDRLKRPNHRQMMANARLDARVAGQQQVAEVVRQSAGM